MSHKNEVPLYGRVRLKPRNTRAVVGLHMSVCIGAAAVWGLCYNSTLSSDSAPVSNSTHGGTSTKCIVMSR